MERLKYLCQYISFFSPVFFFFRQGVFAPEAGHGRKVFAVRFHPFDDNIFLTGGWDRCIKVCTESELVHLFVTISNRFSIFDLLI